MGPVVSSVSEDLNQIDFYSVDVDESPNLPKQFGVMSIPTMILFKDGKEVDRVTGAIPEEAVREFALQ
nr:thioredoxin family protein [Cytobacillus oceanisediminis]